MKKNKVLLKVMVEPEEKKWVKNEAKFWEVSEAEVVRGLIRSRINKK